MHICSIYKIRGWVIFLHLNFLHSRHSAHYVMTVSKSHVVTNSTLILFITAQGISHKEVNIIPYRENISYWLLN